MRESDDLFLLIRSMSKNEKGYFKRFASTHISNSKTTNYLILFEAIEKRSHYDEEELIQELCNTRFVTYLSKEKNHLYSLIIKCLRLYHHASDNVVQVNSILSSIKILYNKGLFKQCEKLIRQGKKLVADSQLLNYELELNKWERELSLNKLKIEEIAKLNLIQKEAYNTAENLNHYMSLYAQLYYHVMRSGDKSYMLHKKEITEIIESPLLFNENCALSSPAKLYFHHILLIYSHYVKNYKDATYHSNKRIELLDKFPKLYEEDPRHYINALNNHAYLLLTLKRFEEAKKISEIINTKQFAAKSDFIECRKEVRHIILKLTIAISEKNYESNTQLENEINYLLQQYDFLVRMDERITIFYLLSFSWFSIFKYKKALFWLNFILNEKKEIRGDIQCAAQILNILILYSINQNENLDHFIKSAVRFLKKEGNETELKLMNMIKKVTLSNNNPKEHQINLVKLKKHTMLCNKNNKNESALNLLDISTWVDSMIY